MPGALPAAAILQLQPPLVAQDRPTFTLSVTSLLSVSGGSRLHMPGSLNRPGLAALQNLSLHHPLSVLGINYPIAPGRIQGPGGGCRQFAEACRAREVAFDAKHQENPQRMDFDILTFTTALTASEVTSPLIEELGCDKFINSK
ncbi:hypothetical protein EI555_003355 [Monodon monoceros]|uniref:Uncharacterized protein n=1 Tax=Monodon monoceros TaxID=40151 RepID=A0A4U1EHN0_MONMO|nr:hypothetical protein EI555_003355 [Monodon monoceros]